MALEIDEFMKRRGFAGQIGFGRSPAVLVIDMMYGFTDSEFPLASDQAAEIAVIRRVCEAARTAGAPVLFILSQYTEPGCADAGVWRLKQRGY